MTLGHNLALDLDADVAGALYHVDAVVRVARMLEDLLFLFVPGVHAFPVERAVAANVLALRQRIQVAPHRVFGRAIANPHGPVRRLAFVRAPRVQLRGLQQVLPNVLGRKVVHREVIALAQEHSAFAVGDRLAVERHPHPSRARLNLDAMRAATQVLLPQLLALCYDNHHSSPPGLDALRSAATIPDLRGRELAKCIARG